MDREAWRAAVHAWGCKESDTTETELSWAEHSGHLGCRCALPPGSRLGLVSLLSTCPISPSSSSCGSVLTWRWSGREWMLQPAPGEHSFPMGCSPLGTWVTQVTIPSCPGSMCFGITEIWGLWVLARLSFLELLRSELWWRRALTLHLCVLWPCTCVCYFINGCTKKGCPQPGERKGDWNWQSRDNIKPVTPSWWTTKGFPLCRLCP